MIYIIKNLYFLFDKKYNVNPLIIKRKNSNILNTINKEYGLYNNIIYIGSKKSRKDNKPKIDVIHM